MRFSRDSRVDNKIRMKQFFFFFYEEILSCILQDFIRIKLVFSNVEWNSKYVSLNYSVTFIKSIKENSLKFKVKIRINKRNASVLTILIHKNLSLQNFYKY